VLAPGEGGTDGGYDVAEGGVEVHVCGVADVGQVLDEVWSAQKENAHCVRGGLISCLLNLEAEKSEERGHDGGDGHAAVGADANRGVVAHVGRDAAGAEAVAARGEDAQARARENAAVVEADGAREAEILVGLGCDLAVVLAGEGGEAGLDDGVLFGAVLVGQLVELVDLRLERVNFVGV